MALCPYEGCVGEKSWEIRRGKLKCARCRREWSTRWPLSLSEAEWAQLVELVLKGYSTNEMAQNVGLHRQRVLRAVECIRKVMSRLEEERIHRGKVYLGLDEIQVRSHQKNGRPSGKVLVLGMSSYSGLHMNFCQNVTLEHLREVLGKIEDPTDIVIGYKLEHLLTAKISLLKRFPSIEYSFGPLPFKLVPVFDQLRQEIQKKDVPGAKLHLHLAEFVWRHNNDFKGHERVGKREKEKIHEKQSFLLQRLRKNFIKFPKGFPV